MSHYILVHGAWEGAWSWENTAPELQKQGHTITAIDLAGSIGNRQEISEISMAGYIKTVADTIFALDHKVVLVGHSMAGAIISQVAELMPDKIQRLIYIAAFLLKNGDSVLEAMQRDLDGEFLSKLVFSEDQSYAEAPEPVLRKIAFHDVAENDIASALPRMAGKQATEPFMSKVTLSTERFGQVPKTFIRTTIDKITSPALQDEMIKNWVVEKVEILPSGHFPALSMPKRLAAAML